MEFRILGPLEICDGAGELTVGTPRTRAILGILLTTPGQLVSIDRLIDELWPEGPPPDARTLIHSYVSKLRRMSGPVAKRLITRKPGYLLRVDDQELDLHRYEQLVADARKVEKPQDGAALLRRADELWHGPPFANVPATPAIAAAITKLGELRLATLEEQFDAALAAGQNVVADLTELVATHPLRERLVGQLMVALHRAGRTAGLRSPLTSKPSHCCARNSASIRDRSFGGHTRSSSPRKRSNTCRACCRRACRHWSVVKTL